MLCRLPAALLSFCLMLSPFAARAEYVVASGGSVLLRYFGAVDQLCHSLGRFNIGLIQPPRLGRIEVRNGFDFPSFSALNTHSRCNTRREPSTRVLYRAAPGVSGTDEVEFEAVSPAGILRRYRAVILVR